MCVCVGGGGGGGGRRGGGGSEGGWKGFKRIILANRFVIHVTINRSSMNAFVTRCNRALLISFLLISVASEVIKFKHAINT